MDETKRKGPGSRGSAHDVEVKTENFTTVEKREENYSKKESQNKQAFPANATDDKNITEKKEHTISIENRDRTNRNFNKNFSKNGDGKYKRQDSRKDSFQFKKNRKDFVRSSDRFKGQQNYEAGKKQNANDINREIETLKRKFLEQQNLISDIAKQKNDVKPLIASIVALIVSIVAVFLSIFPVIKH
ncbi:hypothetical protein JXA84_01000 [candidate division WOR-3 bacterium]|nr:hypothetical protein [candidate division WOR-3 bacterium]